MTSTETASAVGGPAEPNPETVKKPSSTADFPVTGNSITNAENQPNICSFYRRNGWCGFGRNCRYFHPKSAGKPNPNPDGGSAKLSSSRRQKCPEEMSSVGGERNSKDNNHDPSQKPVENVPESPPKSTAGQRRRPRTFGVQSHAPQSTTNVDKSSVLKPADPTNFDGAEKSLSTAENDNRLPVQQRNQQQQRNQPYRQRQQQQQQQHQQQGHQPYLQRQQQPQKQQQNQQTHQPYGQRQQQQQPQQQQQQKQQPPQQRRRPQAFAASNDTNHLNSRTQRPRPRHGRHQNKNVILPNISSSVNSVQDTPSDPQEQTISQSKIPDPDIRFQPRSAANPIRAQIQRPNPVLVHLKSTDIGSEEQKSVKQKACRFLQTRFPKNALVTAGQVEGSSAVQLDFSSTDPDWPFDVHHISLALLLASGYPIESMHCTVNGPMQLPSVARLHIQDQIQAWIKETSQISQQTDDFCCTLREFIRWLDRQLVQMFIEGLRKVRMLIEAEAAGISLAKPVVAEEHVEESDDDEHESDDDDEDNDDDDEDEDSPDCAETDSDDETIAPENSDASGGLSSMNQVGASLPESNQLRPGVCQVKITSWKLGEQIASVGVRSLMLLLSCSRCGTKKEYAWNGTHSNGTTKCERCQARHAIELQPKLLHQYNNIIAEIYLENTTPVDLLMLSSELLITCLACNKQAIIKALNYGQEHKTWCLQCHEKLELTVNTIRFTGTGLLKGGASIKPEDGKKKLTKVPGGPQIREGEQLPDQGACKHYKKSFRWFRFPCCGKLYPCDLCHEEGESHELKFANRIVCGWCSHEQPYQSNKPCGSCKGAVVKTRTKHWEGGKGCRDTLRMSNNDKQKFRSQAKTISRKQLEKKKKEKGKTKKTTKLRHDDA